MSKVYRETKEEFGLLFVECYAQTVWDNEPKAAFIARSVRDPGVVHLLYKDWMVSTKVEYLTRILYPLQDDVQETEWVTPRFAAFMAYTDYQERD